MAVPKPTTTTTTEDSQRLTTAISDALEDLNIRDYGDGSIDAQSEEECLKLANVLLSLKGSIQTAQPTTSFSSWNDLIQHLQDTNSGSIPLPFEILSQEDTKDDDLFILLQCRHRLEILLHLALSVQQLKILSASKHNTTNGKNSKRNQSVSENTSKNMCIPMELPTHLSEDQVNLIQECYAYLQADYDRRLVGMKQRLAILESDFERENAPGNDKKEDGKGEESSAEPATNTITAMTVEDDDMETLVERFSKPHSFFMGTAQPSRSTGTQKTNIAIPEDRGGRFTNAEVRVNMPEWTTERIATPAPKIPNNNNNKNNKNNNKNSNNNNKNSDNNNKNGAKPKGGGNNKGKGKKSNNQNDKSK